MDARLDTDGRRFSANLSPLMQAKQKAITGEVVCMCPFGCGKDKIDEHGYCIHLVGFTNSSEAECAAGKGLLESMIRKVGGRIVRVKRPQIAVEVEDDFENEAGEIETRVVQSFEYGPPEYEKVMKSDVLVRITTSYRVYRKTVEAKTKKPAKKQLQQAS